MAIERPWRRNLPQCSNVALYLNDGEGTCIVLHSKPLMDALDRLRCGGVVLDKQEQVIEFNRTAHQLPRQEVESTEPRKEDTEWVTCAFKRLRLRASRRSRLNGSSWLMTDRRAKQPLAIHLFSPWEGSPNRAAIMVDLSLAGNPILLCCR
jgi:hypothetical protein